MGDVQVPAGEIMLHQILNTDQFNGAGRKVFLQFVDDIVKPSGGDLLGLDGTRALHICSPTMTPVSVNAG